jgi:CheY-like chemotaxis protein/tRNA A-37 threonylcarbamoyl transferase component Bud32
MEGGGLKLGAILVVDDDLGLCRYLRTLLTRVGYEVDSTEDGEKAIEILKKQRYDLVITDLTMPNVGGMELLESIKASGIDTDVLVMSAAGSIPRAVQAIKLGALNYIEKPVERSALLEEVRAAFRARKEFMLAQTITPATKTAPRRAQPNSRPTRIGRYEIERVLGTGGMGTVYAAFDPELDRSIAIKTVHPPLALREKDLKTLKDRFVREARSAAQLSHPNIAAIYDFGTDDESEVLYFAMELVPGIALDRLLEDEGPLPIARAVRIAYQVADALELAHRHGIVHRDVKPSNVIVGEGDHAKLLDFGVAHLEGSDLTRPGHLLGSPSYVAPEAALGLRVDHRADQFSLGVLFLEMLANQKVFGQGDVVETLRQVVHKPVPRLVEIAPDAPPGLQGVLDRLTQKDPAQRYADEMVLLSELAAAGEKLGLRLQPAIPHSPV